MRDAVLELSISVRDLYVTSGRGYCMLATTAPLLSIGDLFGARLVEIGTNTHAYDRRIDAPSSTTRKYVGSNAVHMPSNVYKSHKFLQRDLKFYVKSSNLNMTAIDL
jgi:hypothetical protein